MSRFIQLHILTSYPASNLNRDDLGQPKSVIVGNTPRLRVSSQSLKRAWRTSDVFRQAFDGAMGTRTKSMGECVYRALTQGATLQAILEDSKASAGLPTVAEKKAEEIAKAVAGVFGALRKSTEAKKEAEQEAAQEGAADAEKVSEKAKMKEMHIEQLAHFGPAEIEAIAKLVEERRADGKKPDAEELDLLRNSPGAVDIAMFGRMLAASKPFNVEAAVQVAHAMTVHKVVKEDDFFTAVDDLNRDETGAGHMGVFEFGAGLYYLYVCIDRDLLVENLADDEDAASRALEALVRTACTVSPTGKQNSFASRANASFCLAEKGDAQPRTLSSAFLQGIDKPADVLAKAVDALMQVRSKFEQVYGDETPYVFFDVSGAESKGTLQQVCEFVRG
ncbi:type I-E CRISPR-associated protein Cas7/Cse4/CasC [Oceanidesulfovibrio marinus]|uniref:Type I-E CRISPR-associated protein Cas7/Cse4/CasC n=1 Tax=Oceanidesulfovibrio marinus TaxID=370038 RepID=A0ABX6ND85_9BACT|nr:type I-E CRISPR-associated protein Cas7/Cse4/CasC [Oceanidesulfovibrio marinus]QJT08018.1 type I-E CRISPR-associated protein Cas7/Cse4/CasC [Oceanidesulfovibrio marinus]